MRGQALFTCADELDGSVGTWDAHTKLLLHRAAGTAPDRQGAHKWKKDTDGRKLGRSTPYSYYVAGLNAAQRVFYPSENYSTGW